MTRRGVFLDYIKEQDPNTSVEGGGDAQSLYPLCRGHDKESGASWLLTLVSIDGLSFRLDFQWEV